MLSAMSWSNKPRHRHWGRYHHGNLKEALLKAARDLVAECGPQGFSLAEAARRAGVSPAAPYRHFTDRQALMAEIARQGFASLATRLHEGWNDGLPDPPTAFLRMGAAYLAFANEEPAAYAAMFLSGVAPAVLPELRETADRAFAVLVGAASRLGGQQPDGSPAEARQIALHMWALAHGIATLAASGAGAGKGLLSPDDAKKLLEAGCAIYLAGLRIGAGRKSANPAANR